MPAERRQSLTDASPQIASEWDHARNGDLSPETVSCTSTLKTHWVCSEGHRWAAEVRSRVRSNSRCPSCGGMRPTSEYNLATQHPDIAAQWNVGRNGQLRPEDFLPASMKRVWWLCEKGHEWEAAINNRYAGNSCPFCSNRRVGYGNDLATTHRDLCEQWHSEKNQPLAPSQFTAGSGKSVWWRCADGHEWKTSINERTNGSGCPYCVRQTGTGGTGLYARHASKEYNFATCSPEAASEWLLERNGNLSPREVTPSSGRKYWFRCPKGHEYEMRIADRSDGQGCPYCAGKKVLPEESFAAKYPEIAAQWDRDKNGSGPEEFTPYSGKKAWWRCSKGHSWKISIGNRTGRASGCPFCATSNARAAPDNNLTVTHPDLIKEWDFERNPNLDPTQLLAGSSVKAAWRCVRGHRWKAVIGSRTSGGGSRTSGRGCPKCRTAISRIELRVFSELSEILGNVQHHKFVGGVECDILIEGNRPVAVEVDGRYWHAEKFDVDVAKNNRLASLGVTVVRLRDRQLGPISDHDVLVDETNLLPGDIAKLVTTICSISGVERPADLDQYAAGSSFRADQRFSDLSERLPLPPVGKSLLELHPQLAAAWDNEKNSTLTPAHLTPGSTEWVWWRCSEGHSFERKVCVYVKSSRCPHCHGSSSFDFVPLKENSFGGVRPDLIASWHPTKNVVSPYEVTQKSNKLRWWVCEQGHEWETTPERRQKYGCPYCAGQKLAPERSLAAVAPDVAEEWHPALNGEVTPNAVATGSKIKPWWRCKQCGHEWQAQIYDRAVRKTSCPRCRNGKRDRRSD